jgi:hypothetical protein
MKQLPKIKTQGMVTTNLITSVGILLFVIAILLGNAGVMHKLNDLEAAISKIEAKVDISNPGKATLTNGSTCILDQEALADEQLAVRLVQACVKAQGIRQEQDKADSTSTL